MRDLQSIVIITTYPNLPDPAKTMLRSEKRKERG